MRFKDFVEKRLRDECSGFLLTEELIAKTLEEPWIKLVDLYLLEHGSSLLKKAPDFSE